MDSGEADELTELSPRSRKEARSTAMIPGEHADAESNPTVATSSLTTTRTAPTSYVHCDRGDATVEMPPALKGCTLSGGSFEKPLTFGVTRLVEIGGNPTYWHYSLTEVKDSHHSAGSKTAVLQGDLTLVPVGNALGDFKCTEIHSLSPHDLTQTCDRNILKVKDRVMKEFCSNVSGVKRDDEISFSEAVLSCPRDFVQNW